MAESIKIPLEQRALLRAHEDQRDEIRNVIRYGVIPNINKVLPLYMAFLADMQERYVSLAEQYGEDVGEAGALIPEFVQLLNQVQAKAYEIDTKTPGLFGLEPLPVEPEMVPEFIKA
jgi:hypothetical protein